MGHRGISRAVHQATHKLEQKAKSYVQHQAQNLVHKASDAVKNTASTALKEAVDRAKMENSVFEGVSTGLSTFAKTIGAELPGGKKPGNGNDFPDF